MLLAKAIHLPLDCKEIKPVNPKGNWSWKFIGRSDAEAETPKLWPPHARNWLTGRDPDAAKYWRQEEKGTTEDEIVERHHWLDGHEFEQALGVGDGQGSLACCSSWSHKELDTTEQLNWTGLNWTSQDVHWQLVKSMGRLENQPWRLAGISFRIVAPEDQQREISGMVPQQEGSGQVIGAPTVVSILPILCWRSRASKDKTQLSWA